MDERTCMNCGQYEDDHAVDNNRCPTASAPRSRFSHTTSFKPGPPVAVRLAALEQIVHDLDKQVQVLRREREIYRGQR